ncbi:MAG: diol dehydratase small subunit [Spirochaetaceae bacterium]|nr:diol dehydratase small subunit [Spirochaetaceae bacterium]
MDPSALEKIIRDVIAGMETGSTPSKSMPAYSGGKITAKDYPLAEKSVDKLKTSTGKGFRDVTLDAVMNGSVGPQDVRITAETLEMQAQVAESIGRKNLASNFRRAGELVAVPDQRILEIYNALRPYHATKQELLAIADELEGKYNAKVVAAHVREAAEVGAARNRLKKD